MNTFAGALLHKIGGIPIPFTSAAITGDPAKAEKQIREFRIFPLGFLGLGFAHIDTLQVSGLNTEKTDTKPIP